MEILRRIRRRRGFTLVEMLMVIIVIAILAAMLLVAFNAARTRSRVAIIKMEIDQLAMAMENYKQQFGEYPPDFSLVDHPTTTVRTTARQAVLRHIRKRFPRYGLTGSTDAQWITFANDVWVATRPSGSTAPLPADPAGSANVTGRGLYVTEFDPRAAIVFWLGGLPEVYGSTNLTGFSANPSAPFSAGGSRIPRLFDFSLDRLGYALPDFSQLAESQYGATSIPVYGSLCTDRQPSIDEQFVGNTRACPYWYFKAYSPDYYYAYTVKPYYDSRSAKWVNPDSFQIVSAGLDGGFGATTNDSNGNPTAPLYPSGVNFRIQYSFDLATVVRGTHEDNITNFTAKGTIKDDMP